MLVHVDTFNSSCGLNRSDSSVVFNRSDSSYGFNSSAGGGFASANVGTTGSTGDFSGGSVENVLHRLLDVQVGYGKRQTGPVSG